MIESIRQLFRRKAKALPRIVAMCELHGPDTNVFLLEDGSTATLNESQVRRHGWVERNQRIANGPVPR